LTGEYGDRVAVLLSTYRAGPFLKELLESLWAQDYQSAQFRVRDDGSGDETAHVVREQLSGRADASLVVGEHLGPGQSFLALLAEAASDPAVGYAAFCDQDDVWLPGKLSAAVEALREVRGPALYCAAVELVGPELSRLKVHRRCTRGPSFANALVENIATGCTIVLNRPGMDLVSSCTPLDFIMHDAWCYLVIAGCGTVVYDPRPRVLYRLHGSNAVGVGATPWAEWLGRLRRHFSEDHLGALTRQARELERLHRGDLKPGAAHCLEEFLSAQSRLGSRLWYAINGSAHFQRHLDSALYRLAYATYRP